MAFEKGHKKIGGRTKGSSRTDLITRFKDEGLEDLAFEAIKKQLTDPKATDRIPMWILEMIYGKAPQGVEINNEDTGTPFKIKLV